MEIMILVACLAGGLGFFIGRLVGYPAVRMEIPPEIQALLKPGSTATMRPSTQQVVYLTEEHDEKVAQAAKNQT